VTQDPSSQGHPSGQGRVNFFRPLPGFMRKKVHYIWILLASWAAFTFGFQFILVLLQEGPAGCSQLTTTRFLGFPFHYWFSGQFLILWFILLCLLYNLFVDKLTNEYRKRK